MTEKTLLDEFAGQVLAGYCSSPELYSVTKQVASKHGVVFEEVLAKLCYTHALAMMAEREKHVKEGPTPGNPLIPIEQQKPASKLIRVTEMKDGERAVIRKWGSSPDLINTHVFRRGGYLHEKKSGEQWWKPWRDDGNPHEAYNRDTMLVELLSEKGAV